MQNYVLIINILTKQFGHIKNNVYICNQILTIKKYNYEKDTITCIVFYVGFNTDVGTVGHKPTGNGKHRGIWQQYHYSLLRQRPRYNSLFFKWENIYRLCGDIDARCVQQGACSGHYTLSDKGEPTAMTFLHASKNLVVMQDFSYGGTYNSNFIQFHPFGMGFSPIIEYRPGELFQHITEHDSKYYLASGGSRWFWKDGPVIPTGSPDPNCPKEADFFCSEY